MVLGHCGKLYLIGQTEEGIYLIEKLGYADNLVLYLLGSKEYMCIILREATHAEKPVERTGKLMAMYSAEFAVADGEFLI